MINGKKDKKLYMAGANIWALWHMVGKPKYELIQFVGYNTPMDQYMFQSKRDGRILTFSMDQIIRSSGYIRPFLINTDLLDGAGIVQLK